MQVRRCSMNMTGKAFTTGFDCDESIEVRNTYEHDNHVDVKAANIQGMLPAIEV